MPFCRNCGREMQFVHVYNQYYCQYCQQYEQAAQQAAPPPPPPTVLPTPPPPPQQQTIQPATAPQQQQFYQQPYPNSPPPSSKPRSKKPIIIVGVVIIALLIVTAGYFFVLSPSEDDDTNTVSMDMSEFENEMTYYNDNAFEFKSLEPGDTLIIEDTIIFIVAWWDLEMEPVTYIWFESLHKNEGYDMWYDYDSFQFCNYDLTFEGDLTDDFEEGDTVEITLNVIQANKDGNSIETFEEMWDGHDFCNLPKSCIKYVSTGFTVAKFPKLEVDVDHTSSTDRILIKHIDGDPLDWTKYKIIITNASDSADTATLTSLMGEITAGQTITFINTTYIAMNDVKFEVGGGYDIEIYNIKKMKRELLAENVICTRA